MKLLDKFKNAKKYNKINILIIVISLAMLFCLSIGYSVLQQYLDINSLVTLRAQKDIRITNLSNPQSTNGAYEQYNSRYTENDITNNIILPELDSTISYDVTITNAGNVPMKIKDITTDVFNNDNVTYVLDGVSKLDVVAAGEHVTFSVTFKYKSTVTTLPSNTSLGSVISFEFEEYITDPTLSYITGATLNLEGINPPVDSKWQDLENNKDLTLTSVTHDSGHSYYTFGSNSVGNLGETIINRTGDFTLEALIKTPATFSTTEDQAILSQVNQSSNDNGRFKLNFRVTNNNAVLQIFVNQTSNNTPGNFIFASVAADTNYLIQVVRKDGNLKLYVNGILVSTETFDVTNYISQTNLKLGQWNTSSKQQYTGKIYAVRYYPTALDDDDMLNNYQVDQDVYLSDTRTLKQFAIETSFVATGNGLYSDTNSGYRYRGTTVNNYLKFVGDTDTYRIINFENDGTMKILNTSKNYNIAYDESGNRDPVTSKYCVNAASNPEGETDFYGCNYFNTTDSVTGGSDDNVSEFASIKDYINGEFYNSLPNNIKSKVLTHKFYTGRLGTGFNISNIEGYIDDDDWTGKVGLINAKDLFYSITGSYNVSDSYNGKSYLVSLTTSNTLIWTMTPSDSNTHDVLTISRGTGVSKRRSSRTYQMNGTVRMLFYAYPAFYIRNDYSFSGSGSQEDPFIIKEE